MLLFLAPHVHAAVVTYTTFSFAVKGWGYLIQKTAVHQPCGFEDIIIPKASWGGPGRSQ